MDQFTTTHYILSQNIFMIFNLVASSKVDLNWCLSRLCVCVLSSFDGRSPVEPIAHPNGRLRIEIRLRTNQIDVKYHSECSLEWTHLHTWRWRSNDAFEFCLHERKRKKQKKEEKQKTHWTIRIAFLCIRNQFVEIRFRLHFWPNRAYSCTTKLVVVV